MLWLMDSPNALPSTFRESGKYENIEFMWCLKDYCSFTPSSTVSFFSFLFHQNKKRQRLERKEGGEIQTDGQTRGSRSTETRAHWLNLRITQELFGLSIRTARTNIKSFWRKKERKKNQQSQKMTWKRRKITTRKLKMATDKIKGTWPKMTSKWQ